MDKRRSSATWWSKARSAPARPASRGASRARLSADLLLEQPQENPFLARFYQDMPRYALPAQLFFLFQRVAHARAAGAARHLRAGRRSADFLLDKDPLFARITLYGRRARALPEDLRRAAAARAGAGPGRSTCRRSRRCSIERVRRRAAGYERGISEEYLALLAESYARFFHHYDAAPVLTVNSENLNFVERDADFELLVGRACARMKSRREFFNLG